MKDRWITTEQAASLSGRSTRTIFDWAKKYGLTKRSSGNHTLFDAVEVNAVMDAQERPYAPTPQLIAVLATRLAKVEAELEVLSYTAGRYQPIEVTPSEARTLYETVTIFSEGEVPSDMIEECVGFLNGVTEEMFDQLLELDILHPWIPFFTLAANLQSQLRNSNNFSTDLDMQVLYRRLSVVRERLRGIALIYIEMDLRSDARETFHEYVGDGPGLEAELRRRMFWKKKGPNKKQTKSTLELIQESLDLLSDNPTMSAKRRAVNNMRAAIRAVESEKIRGSLG